MFFEVQFRYLSLGIHNWGIWDYWQIWWFFLSLFLIGMSYRLIWVVAFFTWHELSPDISCRYADQEFWGNFPKTRVPSTLFTSLPGVSDSYVNYWRKCWTEVSFKKSTKWKIDIFREFYFFCSIHMTIAKIFIGIDSLEHYKVISTGFHWIILVN